MAELLIHPCELRHHAAVSVAPDVGQRLPILRVVTLGRVGWLYPRPLLLGLARALGYIRKSVVLTHLKDPSFALDVTSLLFVNVL